jgi:2-dehydro-3-deoxy-D-arabinonate dehydratase
MDLTRHQSPDGPRWARDGRLMPASFNLGDLLALPVADARRELASLPAGPPPDGAPLAPIEDSQEVWACGVTYLSSRLAREAESQSGDVYQKVYVAERPELFFKSAGWRAVGSGSPLRIRRDSTWDVPEPELTLVLTSKGEILGFTVGNDLSSRSIEGENPLYLPQAKVFDGCCGLGPCVRVADPDAMRDLPVSLEIARGGAGVFSGETRTSQMKRRLEDLAGYLVRELSFPHGAFLMTGTGIVPSEEFTLKEGDLIRIGIGELVLENPIAG